MADLTILYITASELPKSFAEYQMSVLLDAAGDYPIISASRQPLDLGINILDTEQRHISNIYRQILKMAKLAETEFVAIAEDDTLYHKDHFNFYRPDSDTFAYDQNRFALFTWGEPTYSWRNRKSNASLIAPRLLLIEALEERFAKYPEGTPAKLTGEVGRNKLEKQLGLTERKSIEVFCEQSMIQINHDTGTEDRQRSHRKRLGQIKAFDIPHWGKASDIIANYK